MNFSDFFRIFAIEILFIVMKDKSLELLTEEELKFHEEFTRCQSVEEIDELEKKQRRLYESQGNQSIPHYDMTLEEFRAKYHTTSHEEIMKKMGA